METDEEYLAWAEEICRRLKLKPGFRKEELARAVAKMVGCELVLSEHDLEGSTLYGFCGPAGEKRFVITFRNDSPFHQRLHTVCHEVSHILHGHVTPVDCTPIPREFGATSAQERVAEKSARALVAIATGSSRSKRRRRSSIAKFWNEVGGTD
jgi:hypothetical protein